MSAQKLIQPFSRRLLISLAGLIILAGLPFYSRPAALARAAAGSADLVTAVNALRASNSLAPLEMNDALMAAAQGHSEYMASIGQWTHTGKDGSSPQDRAAAAGYGGGAEIYVSENIATGSNLSAESAVRLWQGDSVHLNTMLSASAREVGAGMAASGGTVYYTLVTGYIAGQSGSGASDGAASPTAAGDIGSGQPAAQAATPSATAEGIPSLQISTPQPDGTIIHVVQPGDALVNIALAYHISLADLMGKNGLTATSVIYPGQKLLIQKADRTPTASPSPTATGGTPTATPTRRPTRTPTVKPPPATPVSQAQAAAISTATVTPPPGVLAAVKSAKMDPLLVVIAALVLVGTSLVVVGSVLKRSA